MVQTSTNLSPYGAYSSDHNAVVVQLELDVRGRVDPTSKRYYEDGLGIPMPDTNGFFSWNVRDCGSDMKAIFEGDELTSKQFCVSGITDAEVEAYKKKLVANGYSLTSTTDGKNVKYISFYGENKRVILTYELKNSKDILSQKIGKPVDHLSYPYGWITDVSDEAAEIVQKVGYKTAFHSFGGPIRQKDNDLYHLHRIMIKE